MENSGELNEHSSDFTVECRVIHDKSPDNPSTTVRSNKQHSQKRKKKTGLNESEIITSTDDTWLSRNMAIESPPMLKLSDRPKRKRGKKRKIEADGDRTRKKICKEIR